MYVDSHAHIEMDRFDEDRDLMIHRALEAGVDTIVNVGNGEVAADSHSAAFRIADQYAFVYTTVGVHPHEARLFDDRLQARLLDLASHPKVIAWGEIGLDYHYDNSPRHVQRDVFRKQLRLAREQGLPVVIHTRDAESDTLEILREEWRASELPGVIHCFTGTGAFAEQVVGMGFCVSFSGVITFKNAAGLRRTAGEIPADSLLIETDSPFLAPEPHRGRRNEPAYVVEVARRIAEIRGIPAEEVGMITSANFRRAFGLNSPKTTAGEYAR